MKPNIHSPNFFLLFLRISVTIDTNIARKDTNTQIGYTDQNLFNSVLMVKGFTATQDEQTLHIKLSPNTKNIPSGIKDNINEKNIISAQTLLFSFLFTPLKNINSDIKNPISNHTKWKLYQYGLNNILICSRLVGINQWLKKKLT